MARLQIAPRIDPSSDARIDSCFDSCFDSYFDSCFDSYFMKIAHSFFRLPIFFALAVLSACQGPPPSAELRDAVRDLSNGLPVFPGAQGFGSTTPAGRGGELVRVTSLAADGPGTLREALLKSGPRTVIFEVAGTIPITEPLVVAEPFVTIAGQTAPEPGITVAGAGMVIVTHDVLLQHLRVRAGDAWDGPEPGGRDSLSITGAPDGSRLVHDVVIDHCSFSWAIDEGASTWNPGVFDVTISRSLITENLSHSLHEEGEHSKGLLIGDHARRIAVLSNLFAHNRMRSPFVKGDVSALIVNNVIYNPGAEAIHLDDEEGAGPTLLTVAANLLVPGQDTEGDLPLVDALASVKTTSEVYLFENDAADRDLKHATFAHGIWREIADYSAAAVRVLPLHILPAGGARALVLRDAGARPRDAVDARVIADVEAGSGRIIDSPAQVGGLPMVAPVTRPLEPPPDPSGDADGDGYTNLEEWLHSYSSALEMSR
jgi:hypothetical protein